MPQLVDANGYPGSQGARKVVLGSDGTVSIERFQRASERGLGTQTAGYRAGLLRHAAVTERGLESNRRPMSASGVVDLGSREPVVAC